ncbi:MAG: globin domain-containing protein [Candidatus Kariarchaeaceae archaeon]|jgi:nitric oxide dioxygenase
MENPKQLTSDEIALIKSSWAKIQDDKKKVRNLFYEKIFEIEPEAKPLFRESFLTYDALPDSFLFMFKHFEHLDDVIPEIKRLGLKHKTYGVKKKHYSVGQTALLWTFKQLLKAEFTDEMMISWAKLFDYMTHYMILGMRRK